MNDIPLLLTISSFIGYAFFLKRKFKISFHILPLIIYSLAITIGFFSIFLDFFSFFKTAFCVIGNLFLILEFFFVLESNKPIKNYLQKNILGIIFIFLCLALFLWVNNSKIYGWDEFYWGQFAKFIHAFGSFWTKDSAILASASKYPPGAAIGQNIFMPFGNFNETAIFYANTFPFLCLLILVINLFNKKTTKIRLNVLKTVTSILGTLFLFFYFALNYPGYNLTDYPLEIVFTSGLLIVIFFPTKLKNLYLILPIISTLILLKPVGILLALIIITIALLRCLKEKILHNWKNIFLLLFFIILAFSPYFIWNNYVKKQSLTGFDVPKISLDLLKNSLIIKNSERYQTTWSNFSKYIFTKPLNYVESPSSFLKIIANKDTLINWIIFLFILFIIIIYLKKNKQEKLSKDIISYLVLFGGLFCWIFFHLFMWLTVFSSYEGPILASYERYMSIFLVGITTIFFITIIQKIKNIRTIILVFFFIFIMSIYYRSSLFTMVKRPIKNFNPKRTEITELSNNVKDIVKNKNKIYFICQNSSGYEAMVFRYEMSPHNPVQYWGWSLGDKYLKENIWKVVTSKDQLQSILAEYDYIVLNKIDSDFIRLYGDLFNQPKKLNSIKIWRIIKTNTGINIIPAI